MSDDAAVMQHAAPSFRESTQKGPSASPRQPSRWLSAQDVAPTPSQVWNRDNGGGAGYEVAATAMLAAPAGMAPTAAGTRRHRRRPLSVRVAAWPARRIALMSCAIVVFGVAGVLFLSGRLEAFDAAEVGVAVPGSSLKIDKPAGWTEGPVESAPAVLESLVAGETTRRPAGLYLTAPGGHALFIVHTPNSAQLAAVPEVPAVIGAAQVDEQWEYAAELGPARRLRAHSSGAGSPADAFEVEATYMISNGQIFLVGVFANGELADDDVADYETVLASMDL